MPCIPWPIAKAGLKMTLAAAAVSLATFSLVGVPTIAKAAAPQIGTQAPGFYRMMVGSYEITVLSDGTHPFPVHKVLTQTVGGKGIIPLDQAAPGEADALLAESKLSVPVQGSINAFLVNTGSKLILIDSGAGTLYGDCCGHLIDNLRSAGYSPDQVDEIYLTHLHADHVGGIAPGGKMAFKNAVVRVSQIDADYWLNDKNEGTHPRWAAGFLVSRVVTLRNGDRRRQNRRCCAGAAMADASQRALRLEGF